jgi:SNF2 family DNA or RNA helicase
MSVASDGNTITRFLTDSKTNTASVARPKEEQDTVARQTLENALSGAGSSKLAAIVAELDCIWEQDPGSKVLIYSQFLGFLDLIGGALRTNGIPHSRFDGQMSLKERIGALDKFKEQMSAVDGNGNKRGSVLLVSMKAGGGTYDRICMT